MTRNTRRPQILFQLAVSQAKLLSQDAADKSEIKIRPTRFGNLSRTDGGVVTEFRQLAPGRPATTMVSELGTNR